MSGLIDESLIFSDENQNFQITNLTSLLCLGMFTLTNLLFLKMDVKFFSNDLIYESFIFRDKSQFFLNGLIDESPIFMDKHQIFFLSCLIDEFHIFREGCHIFFQMA
jgi:hypothetical protein